VIHRVSTGIPALDGLLEGGFPVNSLILIAGGPGTGKSICAAQFLYQGAMQQQERGLYVLFGESADTFRTYLATLNLDTSALERQGLLELWECPTTHREGVDVILQAILEKARATNVHRLVIDSITSLTLAADSPIDARVTCSLLQKSLRTLHCTTLLVTETPWEQQGIGTGVEEFIADGILLLQIVPEGVELRRRLAVLKMRATQHSLRYYRFSIARDVGINLITYPEA
jgi:KaiC/GvpD/RAD55 family RecA-like ATPase